MSPKKTTCQICGRLILANTGRIARHGYRRPRQGWQTTSCFGAKYRPYEIACDALPPAIESCQTWLTGRQAFLHDLTSNPPDTLEDYRIDRMRPSQEKEIYTRPANFDPNISTWRLHSYESIYSRMRHTARNDIAQATESLAFMQKRLMDWRAPAETAA